MLKPFLDAILNGVTQLCWQGLLTGLLSCILHKLVRVFPG